MEINLRDHISEETMQEIAEQEFRRYVQRQLQSETDLKRFLSNVAYEAVSQACDEYLQEDVKVILKENIARVIQNLSHHTIFKAPDAWDRESNGMYKFLQECMEEQKPVVKEIVKDIVADNVPLETMTRLKYDVQEFIIDAIQDLYRGEK